MLIAAEQSRDDISVPKRLVGMQRPELSALLRHWTIGNEI
jgi:hypothetical protein